MYFADARRGNYLSDIPFVQVAASHYPNTTLRVPDAFGDRLSSLDRRRLLTGSQDAINTDLGQFVYSFQRIPANVERSMKRDRHRTGEFDELSRAPGIDIAVAVEQPDHDAVYASLFGADDITPHDLKFGLGIKEIAAARTNDDMQRDVEQIPRDLDRSPAGGRSTLHQIVAKLDAIRPASLGRNGRFDGIYADFGD